MELLEPTAAEAVVAVVEVADKNVVRMMLAAPVVVEVVALRADYPVQVEMEEVRVMQFSS